MRRCAHYKAVKGCRECEREPPTLCIHGELKGACGKCFSIRGNLVENRPFSDVIPGMPRQQPAPVGDGWEWYHASSTHKETLGWFLAKGYMVNDTYERMDVRVDRGTKKVRFNFTARRLLSEAQRDHLKLRVLRANNL